MTAANPGAAAQGSAFSSYQKFVVAILAFLQFTIVLDFMMLAPLGALVMPALNITPSQFGWVVSTYAFSAGVSGFLAAGFADRFDRKKLLLWFYSGFLAGTLVCGLATSFPVLLIGRMVTGVFAGVVSSVSFAIVTDLFPLQMRGRVMGLIQTAFSVSSVIGIPVALVLSTHWAWNTPFLMIVGVSALVGALIWVRMQPVDEHLRHHPDRSPLRHLVLTVSNRNYLQGFAATGLLTLGGFMLMPFMSVFTVNNIGLAIEKLPLVYMITGVFSMAAGPLIGRSSDALGTLKVFFFGCATTIVMVVIFTHLHDTTLWLLCVVMVILQVGILSRIISATALTSALPDPADRGAYMSISSSLQQLAGGIAAAIAGHIVVENPDGSLSHYDTLGYVLVCTTLLSLVFMIFIDKKVGAISAVLPSAPKAATASK